MNILVDSPKDLLVRSIEQSCALGQYADTLNIPPDVATNLDYQRNFNAYYRIRRDRDWLDAYYAFMQKNIGNLDLSFEDVITHLATVPHKVKPSRAHPDGMACSLEASFSSKLLATINPSCPVWDSQVVKAVGISIPAVPTISFYVEAYGQLYNTVHEFINTPSGNACIAAFDAQFPHYTYIDPVKKIDFFLWNLGK